MDKLASLEERVKTLQQIKVFNANLKSDAEAILAQLPSVESVADVTNKVRVLLLRSRTKMLLPTVCKDAEKDLNAALKLKQGSPETWVELAECQLRRNAFKDAAVTLDNALAVDPECTPALCLYSRVQRNRCGDQAMPTVEKKHFMADSVAKAKAAVRTDVNDSEAWNTLSLALLSQTTLDGMTFDGVRRSLAAMQQAAAKVSSPDPDVHFNKGVLESLLGHFGDAAVDFTRAHELDSLRLKGPRRLCEENLDVLRRCMTHQKNSNGVGKTQFKKLCSSAAAASKKAPAGTVCVAVVDGVSDPKMQPVTLLACDGDGNSILVLTLGISFSAVRVGDVLTIPPIAKAEEVNHDVPAIPFVDWPPCSFKIRQCYMDAAKLLVNGQPLPASARAPLQMSSRLFA